MKINSGRVLDPAALLLHWFSRHRRDLPWRRRRDLYAIWVSEVMLQQTRVDTVVPYFKEFLRRFPTLKRLATAPLQEVLRVWEGLGYYSRARHLWQAARLVLKRFAGRVPNAYDDFRGLPGVGEYIAAAVLSIGRGLAVPVVDGNVLRVVCRWQGIIGDIRRPDTRDEVRTFLQRIIPPATPGKFNEAMMELGALVCTPKNPACGRCPLKPGCHAHGCGLTAVLPVKSRKAIPPQYQVALAAIVRAGKLFIQQRPEQGHLGGLWEFPGGKCRAGERHEHAVVRECREELGIEVRVLAKLAEVRHAYTHFKIVLHVFACRLRGRLPRSAAPHAWVEFSELQNYPFPAANHKFFPQLRAWLSNYRDE